MWTYHLRDISAIISHHALSFFIRIKGDYQLPNKKTGTRFISNSLGALKKTLQWQKPRTKLIFLFYFQNYNMMNHSKRCLKWHNRILICCDLWMPVMPCSNVYVTHHIIHSFTSVKRIRLHQKIAARITSWSGTHWSNNKLDMATITIKNESRIYELPDTKLKRINSSGKTQEGFFWGTMWFYCQGFSLHQILNQS